VETLNNFQWLQAGRLLAWYDDITCAMHYVLR